MATIGSGGVRLRLFPQAPFHDGGVGLETVTLRLPAGMAGPGPSDPRMYVVAPSVAAPPYGRRRPGDPLLLPPWTGPQTPPALPDGRGCFDGMSARDPAFPRVHLWGCARFALDVWEGYLGRPIPWHFAPRFARLELGLLRGWSNAQMGYGWLQTGERRLEDGRLAALAYDFDIVGHEIGHALLLSLGASFSPENVRPDYEALHEASADFAAMIAALHFDGVRAELLDTTAGDLDGFNRLSRFAEFSHTRQIRLASNRRTMRDFAAGWRSEHELSQPVMGALFDAFIDVYHEALVAEGVIPRALEALADKAERDPGLKPALRDGFRRAYDRDPDGFHAALAEARDLLARLILAAWDAVEPERFDFAALPPLLRAADREATGGRLWPSVSDNLARRLIGRVPPGPRRGGGEASHLRSSRTAIPENG